MESLNKMYRESNELCAHIVDLDGIASLRCHWAVIGLVGRLNLELGGRYALLLSDCNSSQGEQRDPTEEFHGGRTVELV